MDNNENKTNGSGSIRRALPEIKVELPRDILRRARTSMSARTANCIVVIARGYARKPTTESVCGVFATVRNGNAICANLNATTRRSTIQYSRLSRLRSSLPNIRQRVLRRPTRGAVRVSTRLLTFVKVLREPRPRNKARTGLVSVRLARLRETHLAACMANAIIKQCKTVLFTNFFKIMSLVREKKMKGGKESDVLDRLTVVDFLFIDDLGAERVSANGEETWVQEYIFNILNDRLSNRMPTIFTSNYGLKELRDEKGLQPRICDRIARMVSWANVKIEAPNYRREQVKNKNRYFKEDEENDD